MFKNIALNSLLMSSIFLSGCAQLLANTSNTDRVGNTSNQRTFSQRIEDSSIERTAAINLHKLNPEIKNSHVVFLSFHSNVLIAGQVVDEKQKKQAEEVLREISEVKMIHNELEITPTINSYFGRATDNALQLQLASKLTFLEGFPSNQVKILIENGVVYFMAKLSKAQTQQALEAIKTTPNLRKIVKLVDYTD